jgi:hypothetical protein
MTPQQAAQWMLAKIQRDGYLDQETVAFEFGNIDPTLVYANDNGGIGIQNKVLAAFNKIAPTTDYVWSRSHRQWRKRELGDEPDKRMQD